MSRKIENIIYGIIFIAVGIVLVLNSFQITNIDLFFEGWWTLFIIIPSLIGLIKDHDKTGSLIGVLVGVVLLLSVRGILEFSLIKKLLVPCILIFLGLSLVFKNVFHTKTSKVIDDFNKNHINDDYCSTFSSQNIHLDHQEFKGTNLSAIFGGITLDLTQSVLKEDVVINACAIFGGIDIILPENVVVKIKSQSLFGGVKSRVKNRSHDEHITIYVNATCLFGGVNIK